MAGCGRCHTCGTRLMTVLDGEEYCSNCAQYRRYQSHGWSAAYKGDKQCPDWECDPRLDIDPEWKVYYAEEDV